ncbi:MAG: hypothetical protein WAZ12_05320 [Candidatus Absconditicoccaceae bacterium]
MTNQINKSFQDQFLDELLLEAGFTADDNLELLKEELKPLLQERITMSIYNQLDQEQKDTVTEMLDHNQLDELNEYLEKIIPDYQEKMMEVYADFEEEYLENMES